MPGRFIRGVRRMKRGRARNRGAGFGAPFPRQRKGRVAAAAPRNVMVNRMPRRAHTAIAPKYFTTMETGFQGAVSTGAPKVQYFDVWGNYYDTAFYANGLVTPAFSNFTGMTNASFVNTALDVSTLQYAGSSRLAQLYQRYKVNASQISVTVSPTAAADIMEICIFPYSINTTTPVTDMQNAKNQPFSKCFTVTGNNNIKQNTLHHKLHSMVPLGISREQYRNLPYLQYAQAPQAEDKLWIWRVMYQTYSNAVTTSNLAFNVKVTASMEHSAPLYGELLV